MCFQMCNDSKSKFQQKYLAELPEFHNTQIYAVKLHGLQLREIFSSDILTKDTILCRLGMCVSYMYVHMCVHIYTYKHILVTMNM